MTPDQAMTLLNADVLLGSVNDAFLGDTVEDQAETG